MRVLGSRPSGRPVTLSSSAVPVLFYGIWFLWPIAAFAATRSYQLRSAALRTSFPT